MRAGCGRIIKPLCENREYYATLFTRGSFQKVISEAVKYEQTEVTHGKKLHSRTITRTSMMQGQSQGQGLSFQGQDQGQGLDFQSQGQ